MKYKHIFFDLDHTIWDYHANATMALNQLYIKFGLDNHFSSPELFISRFNHYNDLMWEAYRQGKIKKEELRYKRFRETFMEEGLDDDQLVHNFGDVYMEITPRLNILFPNALETLEYLTTKNYELYILTNGFLKTQEIKLENAGIDIYFKRIFSSDELGINKPHPGFFHWVVSSLHARKKDCLMIGDDDKVDVGGAKNFGIDAIWFNTVDASVSEAAKETITDLAQLMSIL